LCDPDEVRAALATALGTALAGALLAVAVEGGEGRALDTPRAAAEPRFEYNIARINTDMRKRITGSSWRPGCPVPRRRLRVIRASHWNFDRRVTRGVLIVHRREARPIVRSLRRLFRARFPIRKMNLIDKYGGDDRRSMSADNTSAFNCRFVAGTSRWSEHAYGRAIDVNPIENPYVTASGYVSPPAGRPYADRSRDAKGMIHRGDPAHRAFRRSGWKWGGNWTGTKDYQHFSPSGH